jgi:hypothetical protein
MTWLSTWLFNPLMLGIGAAAILSPIIIHLLNKRRFRIVDWAAMDFLLDADRRNRRRVRLENLILLLLRCAAMFLLGLMLARPFLPSGLAGMLGQARDFQRIVLLDDSLSQQVMIGNQTAFDVARDRLKQFLQALASDGNNDWFTLYVTSQPGQPLVANEPLTGDSVNALIGRVDELECSETVARYDTALASISGFLRDNRSTANQALYILTDLRQKDWQDPELETTESSPRKLLAELSAEIPNTRLVDVGSPLQENLAVTGITVDDLLVADTVIRFAVTVTNFGDSAAREVQLRFRVDDGQPQTETIDSIPPGETATATFRHLFQYDRQSFDDLDFQDQLALNRINGRVQVEIVQQGSFRDSLPGDSEHRFAARVLKGLPILIVDGDPSPVAERSESYYLKGIGLPGTGLLVDTATAGEFETASLGKYRVIFLCNVDEVSQDRIDVLEKWVGDGGGLVFMPGDRVRGATFNQTFWRDGTGLSPLRLDEMAGDATRADWVFMELQDKGHPAWRVALDEEVRLSQVEIFSWWKTSLPEDAGDTPVSVPLVLTDADRSIGMAERPRGNGRVVTFAFPSDADWTMWAAHPTYVCVMWDLVNYLAGSAPDASTLQVGQPVQRLVDLTLYDQDVSLVDPQEEKTQSRAQPIDDSADSSENVLYEVEFPPLTRRGFWSMELARKDGQTDSLLFAANVDPAEGNLRRVDLEALPQGFFGENTRVITPDAMVLQEESGTSNEIWTRILVVLALVLAAEQVLGMWFGRKR